MENFHDSVLFLWLIIGETEAEPRPTGQQGAGAATEWRHRGPGRSRGAKVKTGSARKWRCCIKDYYWPAGRGRHRVAAQGDRVAGVGQG